MKIKLLMIIISSLFLYNCFGQRTKEMKVETVKQLDLNKYLGTWYEIARFDHSFERGLVGVTANYSFRPDGKIKVLNSGYKGSLNGKYKEAIGKAKLASDGNPAHLRVSFFLWFYADYYVLELDEDYTYALIGSNTNNYLWILSRTPQMKKETLDMLIKKAEQRGYDTSKLIFVEQKEN